MTDILSVPVLGGGSGPKLLWGTGTPESAVTAPVGSLFHRSDGGAGSTLYRKESGAGNTGWVAVSNLASKAVTVSAPTNAEKIVLFFTTVALTLSQIRSVLIGSATPSVTFSIRYGTDVSGSGTEVVTSGITVTSTTTGLSTTSFTNGTVPADNFVWLTTSAKSGTVDQFAASLIYQG